MGGRPQGAEARRRPPGARRATLFACGTLEAVVDLSRLVRDLQRFSDLRGSGSAALSCARLLQPPDGLAMTGSETPHPSPSARPRPGLMLGYTEGLGVDVKGRIASNGRLDCLYYPFSRLLDAVALKQLLLI